MSFGEILASVADGTESHMHTAATWLLGIYASGHTAITQAEASDPLVRQAAEIAIQEAAANGTPIADIATIGSQVLALAQVVAAATTQAVPAPLA